MTQYGTWVSYGGDARIWLAIGLLAVAGGVTLAGIRLPLPVRATRPGPVGRVAMIVAWIASIVAFLVCLTIYIRQYIHAYDLSARHSRAEGPHRPDHPDGGRGRLRHHHLAQTRLASGRGWPAALSAR